MMIPNPHGTALTYEALVEPSGRVEVPVPLAAGSRVLVVVIPEYPDPWEDLVRATAPSLGFWDNRYDDEDWNAR
ncbi:MAG: hypothetical protein ACYDA8_11215 [Deferrisomatales bacterium]